MILITGGTGAIGHKLVQKLHAAGKRVRVLTLHTDPHVYRICEIADVVYGDITDPASLHQACSGVSTIYHLAAVILSDTEADFAKINIEGTRNLLAEAKKTGVKHFVYISSASVVYPTQTPYSQSKKAAEELVKTSGIPFTILRPTLVYDVNGAQEFMLFIDHLKRFPAVPFIGNGRSLKRPVFVDDVVDGMAAVCDNKKAVGNTYNLSGGEAITMNAFARLCLRLIGKPSRPIVHVPVALCNAAAKLFTRYSKQPLLTQHAIAGFIQDADLDPESAMLDLNYYPKKVSSQLPLILKP